MTVLFLLNLIDYLIFSQPLVAINKNSLKTFVPWSIIDLKWFFISFLIESTAFNKLDKGRAFWIFELLKVNFNRCHDITQPFVRTQHNQIYEKINFFFMLTIIPIIFWNFMLFIIFLNLFFSWIFYFLLKMVEDKNIQISCDGKI